MGWAFVKRRMRAELGPDWQERFGSFDHQPAAAASLGQVHRATAQDGAPLACKLQYPDMQSRSRPTSRQLARHLLASTAAWIRRSTRSEIIEEISERVREELDYEREARHIALYRAIFRATKPRVRVPTRWPELSTGRLLTMDWLEGKPLLAYKDAAEDRNRLATAMFKAWWHPFSHYAVIHGDPHLGNYTVFEEGGAARASTCSTMAASASSRRASSAAWSISIAGCGGRSRPHRPRLRDLGLPRALQRADRHAEHLGALHLRPAAGRPRALASPTASRPAEYGRRQAFQVHQALKEKGPVTVPREFVFMDRAAIGLGGVFLHLGRS